MMKRTNRHTNTHARTQACTHRHEKLRNEFRKKVVHVRTCQIYCMVGGTIFCSPVVRKNGGTIIRMVEAQVLIPALCWIK